MLRLVKMGWALLTGSREAIVLTVLAVAAAALYAWGAMARAEADRLAAWATTACTVAGVEFTDTAKKSDHCTTRIAELAEFKRQSLEASVAILANAQAEREGKSAADRQLATAQAARRTETQTKMEEADAQIAPDDHVGPDWFARLNDLGGLRAPTD